MRILHHILYIICFLAMIACGEMESWTTSPDVTLRFSRDTVAFDTVITGSASTTQTLVVYNGAKDGVRIREVKLAQGAQSCFQVNVDGQYLSGGMGQDFEVRGKDSMYIRAFVRLPKTDTDEIHSYEDELLFTLESGVVQRVALTSNGLNVDVMCGEVISSDRTLPVKRPIQVFDSLVVQQDVTLTLPAGCTLMFHDGAELIVHGTLRSEGTLEQPVTLRGDRTDRMFPYLPYDRTPNRWGGVRITGESRGNILRQTDLHSSDFGIVVDSTDWKSLSDPVLTLDNSVIHGIGGPGLVLNHTRTLVIGTQITNTLGHCVDVVEGDNEFVHCTIGQFYPFSANRGAALNFTSFKENENREQVRLHFINTAITGYDKDVIFFYTEEEQNDPLPVNYLFQNCLLRTPPVDDTNRFREVRYDYKKDEQKGVEGQEISGEENFRYFDSHAFLYDFTPDSLSVLCGMADAEWAQKYPVDRCGRSRIADEEPDCGAFERN